MDIAKQTAKAEAFLALHHAPEILVLANSWDVATTRVIARAGFPAIATTSAGIAFDLGYPDGERIGRDEMLAVVGRIARSVDLPVTADMESGYGPVPEDVAETVRLTIEAGAAGMNLEDVREDGGTPALLDFEPATARIRAARRAADATGVPAVINARTDTYFFGKADDPAVFEETVRRCNAYLEAGARCAYVPFLFDAGVIGRLAEAIDGPLNVLAGPRAPSAPELEALGVARVSVGSGPYRAALTVVQRAAEELKGPGTYGFSEGAIPHAEVNRLLAARPGDR